MPEAVTCLTLLGNALFVAGVALMLAVILWGLRASTPPLPSAARERGLGGEVRPGGWRATLICGALLFLLGNVHSYDVVILYALLGVLFLARAISGYPFSPPLPQGEGGRGVRLPWPQAVARYATLAVMGAPTIAWQYYVQKTDPIWAAKYLVPKTSPPLTGFLLGYGLVLLAALIGAVYALRPLPGGAAMSAANPARFPQPPTGRIPAADGTHPAPPRVPDLLLPVLWLLFGFALIYAPFNFQRKLAEGLHLPLCLLAALALDQLGRRLPTSSFRLAVVVFLILTLPSNLLYVADGLAHAHVNNLDLAAVNYPPAFLTDDELAGLRWLGAHTTSADIVLSSVYIGNYIPAYAPCHVVAGHWDETVHFGEYLGLTHHFFAPSAAPDDRRALLAQSRATLVFYGPQEQILQRLLQPLDSSGPETADPSAGLPELREIFRQGNVTIYAVRDKRA
jgi:hypothetical protein